MKIIGVDNYDRETVSDDLIAENVNPWNAKRIVDLLNEKESEDSNWFFKAVPDDHKLFKFEP